MDKKSVLIIGSGAREHALGWKIVQSKSVSKIYFAPGNGGTSKIGENLDFSLTDNNKILEFAKAKNIDLTVVGPENSLEIGIVDLFQKNGLLIYGPSKKAAEIETSKAWAIKFMDKYKIPHPTSYIFNNYKEAEKFLESLDERFKKGIVIKADGLTLGKGVFVCKSAKEAKTAVKQIMVDKIFADSGNKVVIQERLKGYEVSVTVISDGRKYLVLPYTEDHKPVFDGDKGANTGGMGVAAPHSLVTKELIQKIENKIVKPTISNMQKEGREYRGTLYPGLMIVNNEPFVLEYNCRFGDPETESLLPLIPKNIDFYKLIESAAKGKLINHGFINTKKDCTVVALASGGYPQTYKKGVVIHGLNSKLAKDVIVFHAATKINDSGQFVTNGGRVLMVSSVSSTLSDSYKKAYKAIGKKGIHFNNMHFRKDIGRRKRKYD